jgi:hypothetical protein
MSPRGSTITRRNHAISRQIAQSCKPLLSFTGYRSSLTRHLWPPVPLTLVTLDAAESLIGASNPSFWDIMIVAACMDTDLSKPQAF